MLPSLSSLLLSTSTSVRTVKVVPALLLLSVGGSVEPGSISESSCRCSGLIAGAQVSTMPAQGQLPASVQQHDCMRPAQCQHRRQLPASVQQQYGKN